jgi:hypothetical protein
MFGDGGDDCRNFTGIADIESPGPRRSACSHDVFRDGFCARCFEIGHGDLRSFGGEDARAGAPHAAGGAGDEHGQSLHRPAELFEFGHRTPRQEHRAETLAPIAREVNDAGRDHKALAICSILKAHTQQAGEGQDVVHRQV